MTRAVYLVSWALVSALIFFFVGLAFVPHTSASLLTDLQKFLAKKMDDVRGRK